MTLKVLNSTVNSKISKVVPLRLQTVHSTHSEVGQLVDKTCVQVESQDAIRKNMGQVLPSLVGLLFHLQWSQYWKTFSYPSHVPHFLLFRVHKPNPFYLCS